MSIWRNLRCALLGTGEPKQTVNRRTCQRPRSRCIALEPLEERRLLSAVNLPEAELPGDGTLGEIRGSKWNDLDGDGVWDQPQEPGLEGWTIYLDENENGQWDGAGVENYYDVTAADGSYSIGSVPAGTYQVAEQPQPGWLQTCPDEPGPDFQGAEFHVSGEDATPSEVAFASSKLGHSVAVWSQYNLATSETDIVAQRFNGDGTLNGDVIPVNTFTTGNQNDPSVAMDSTGRFMVVWYGAPQDSSEHDVFARRFNADGTPDGGEFRVNTYTEDDQVRPNVAMNGSGEVVVAWTSYAQAGFYPTVFAQRYDSDGTPEGSEFQVGQYYGSQTNPCATMTDTGRFVIAWNSNYQDGDVGSIVARSYGADGVPSGDEFVVNTHTTGQQLYPDIASNDRGEFVVVWESEGQDGSDYGVFGRRFEADGTPVGGEFQVNTYTTSFQQDPSIAMDSLGNFVVVWESSGQDGDSRGVYAQMYHSDGTADGTEFRVNDSTSGSQSEPEVAMNGESRFVVGWGDWAGSDLTAKQYVGAGTRELILASGEVAQSIDFGDSDVRVPEVTLSVASLTNDPTPGVTVSATDNDVLPDGTAVAMDVDLNGDGDYLDAGEADYISAVLASGTAVFEITPALTHGTYSLRARVSDPTGNEGTSPIATTTVDLTAPTAESIVCAEATPTQAESVTFTITFSEPVTGVTQEDFVLAVTGVTGASITGLSGSGASYTVTADTGSGDGMLGLNLVNDGSIADAIGNPLANGFAGESYVIDRIAPLVGNLRPADNAADVPVNTNLVIAFNENVRTGAGTVVIKLAADDSIVATMDVGGTAVSVAGSTAAITPPVMLLERTGYYVDVSAGAFEDLAGNDFAGIAGSAAWSFTTGIFLPTSFQPPAALNSNAESDSGGDYQPHVATDGSDTWIAVWESTDSLGGTIGTDRDILVSRSYDAGVTWTAPVPLNTNAGSDSGNDMYPRVKTDGAGNWVTLWFSADSLGGTIGTDYDILVSRSTDAGATWSAPTPLNTNAASDSRQDMVPEVTTDRTGNWVAVWQSDDSLGGTIGTDYDILVSRSTDAGLTWTAPAALNSNAGSDSGADYSPRLSTDAAGNWVAVWQSSDSLVGTIGTDFDILVSRSADAGLTWTFPASLNANAGSDSGADSKPEITTNGTGTWVAVWYSDENLGGTVGTDTDIFVSRSVDAGATWNFPDVLNSYAESDSGDDSYPVLTTDPMGDWVAVWHSSDSLGGTIGTDGDILVSQSGDGGLTWAAAVPLNSNAASDTGRDAYPQLATDGTGNWIAVWHSPEPLGGVIDSDSDILFATIWDTAWECGDAPAPYPTRVADNGARHAATGPSLGAHRDLEPDGQPDPGAAGDDYSSIGPPDDEDGVILPVLTISTTAAITANLEIDLQNASAVANYLDAWIDFNRDGDWSDSGEQIFTSYSLGTTDGSRSLAFTVPQDTGDNVVPGATCARFRVSTTGGLSPTGFAVDGEVEDHVVAMPWFDASEALNSNAGSDSGNDSFPQLVTDGSGNWIAVWHSSDSLGGTIGSDADILVSRSPDAGFTWTAPLPLNTNAASDVSYDYRPQVTTDGAGNWVAVWVSADTLGGTIGTDLDILVARSVDGGATWTDPAPLNANAGSDSGNDNNPQITTDGAGNWVAVWESNDSLGGTVGTDIDILLSRSTNAGATWTYPAPLNSYAGSDSATSDLSPQLATDRSGNWIAVWHSNTTLGGTIGSDYDILMSHSSDAGLTWTTASALATYAQSDSGYDESPQITTDGQGNWVAVWCSSDTLGGTIETDYDILVSRSVDSGVTWTAPAPLNTNAGWDSGSDSYPQVATDALGNWFAVWHSTDSLGGSIGIDDDILVSRSVDAGATWTPPIPVNTDATTDSGNDDYPQITTDGAGRWIAVWDSTDSLGATIGTDHDILFATFSEILLEVPFDFGDAPSRYPTLFPNGACHLPVGPTLGVNRDAELNGQPSLNANRDDNNGTTDDEDGVMFGPWIAGQTATVYVWSSAANAKLDAWIDFNGDGTWDDSAASMERVFSSVNLPLGGTWNVISFPVPAIGAGSFAGITYARFRISSEGGLTPTGAAVDGEVEDYRGLVRDPSVPTTIYVAQSWANPAIGEDPDGAGPALAYGFDSGNNIQGGVSVSVDGIGDTVSIAPGTYIENVTVNKNGLTLRGATSTATDIVLNGIYAEHGIEILADNVTIQNLRVTDAFDSGISASDVSGLALVNVQVDANSDYGIRAYNLAGLALTDVVASTNSLGGLYADNVSGSISINGGQYVQNSQWGMYFLDAGNVTITNATVEANNSTGLSIWDASSLTVNGGTFNDNLYGIDVFGNVGPVAFTGVTARLNTFDGASLDGNSTILVEGGVFSDNGQDGLEVNAGSTTSVIIENAEFRNNLNDGVAIEYGTATIRYNNLVGNDGYGVEASGAGGAATAADNWWGSYAGPGASDAGGRTGDTKSSYVDAAAWSYGEFGVNTDGDAFDNGHPTSADADDDNDGAPDVNELIEGTDPLTANSYDLGDAPDGPYPTRYASNGARHLIGSGGPCLGTVPDSELDGQPDSAALGDDNAGTSDDEDGVILPTLTVSTTTTTTVNLKVNLQNADVVANYLDAWIDFNQDGDWDDPGEQIFTSYNLGTANGLRSLTLTLPQDAGDNVVWGATFARFRLSTTGGLSPTGFAEDGEVEDYRVVVSWFGPPDALNTNAGSDAGDDEAPQVMNDGAGTWLAVWQSTDTLGGTIGSDSDVLVARSTDTGAAWTAPAALNTNAGSDSGHDSAPQIMTDGVGNWIAVWQSTDSLGGTIGTDFDILVSRSNDGGITWTAPAALNGNAGSDSGHDSAPQITTDRDGLWVVVWESADSLEGTIGTDHDILVSYSVDVGVTWSSPVPLNSNAGADSGDDRYPQVATDEAGNWLAVWESYDSLDGTIGTDSDILMARSTDAGGSWTTPASLNANAGSDSGNDLYPQITINGAGTWVVVWESVDTLGGTIGADSDILVSRSANVGITWSPPEPLNSNAGSDPENDYRPEVATDGAGNWIATWYADDGAGANHKVLVSRSADDGDSWSAPAPLDINTGSDTRGGYDPVITSDGSGIWLAAWTSRNTLEGTIGTDRDILFAVQSWGPVPHLYVDADAASGGDGYSWATACNDLDLAVDAAADLLDLGISGLEQIEIWIAEGTYVPTRCQSSTDPRSATFTMQADTTLVGGFAGTETSADQRLRDSVGLLVHQTVLSGDLGVAGVLMDNAYTVVYAYSQADLVLDGLMITGGYANGTGPTQYDTGGGLFVYGGSAIMNDVTFVDNSCICYGGALRVSGASVAVRGSRFYNNRALLQGASQPRGGAINAYNASMEISNSIFEGNSAYQRSGAVELSYTLATIEDSVFRGNVSGGSGAGAVCTTGSPVTFDRSVFVGNTTSGDGGAAHVLNAGTFSDCTFFDNSATGGGALSSLGSYDVTVNQSVFIGNHASDSGGAIRSYSSVIRFSTITGNHARGGGGVRSDNSVSLVNTIVAGNTAYTASWGTDVNGYMSAEYSLVGDSSAWYNAADYVGLYGNVVGTAAAPIDPLFTRAPSDGGDGWGDDPDTAGLDESANDDYGDLHPQPASPAVNAGNTTPPAWTLDLDGHPRVVHATIDMGAYEYQNHTPVADAGGPYGVASGGSITLDASASIDPDSPHDSIVSYAWDFDGDGLFDDAAGAAPVFSAAGLTAGSSVTIAVQVSDTEGSLHADSATVHICGAPVYLDASANNDTILVTPAVPGGTAWHRVQVNSQVFNYDPALVGEIHIDGLGGTDSIRIYGTDEDEIVALAPGSVSFTGQTWRLQAAEIETIIVTAGTGHDQVAMTGSAAGCNRLYSYADYSRLLDSTRSFAYRAEGFDELMIDVPANTNSYAFLYDSPQNDVFDAEPSRVILDRAIGTSEATTTRITGFPHIYAYATGGGTDAAVLAGGSTTVDRFFSYSDYSFLTESNSAFYFYARGFDTVTAASTSSATGYAYLHDSPGSDLITANPNLTTMNRDTSWSDASVGGFDRLYAYSTRGGTDSARLIGSSAGNRYRGYPTYSTMTDLSDSFYYYVKGFYSVKAEGSGSSSLDDRAYLYDSSGADTLVGHSDSAILRDTAWTTYQIEALYFDYVYARSSDGVKNDTIDVDDSLAYNLIRYGTW